MGKENPFGDSLFTLHQHPLEGDEDSQVVSIMIGDEQRFAQDRLAVTVSDRREQIGRLLGDQALHFIKVGAKSCDRLMPGVRSSIARRSFSLRPVALRPRRRHMIRIAAEFQYVPLRDPHVLKNLPRRVRDMLYLSINQLDGKVCDHAFKVDVRAAAAQQV